MRSRWMVLAFTLVACGGDTSTATGPSTNPNNIITLSGSWSGKLLTGGSEAIAITWMANQTGSSATGPMTATQAGDANHTTLNLNGTLAGTLTGNQATLTLTIPPGAFLPAGGPAACKLTGTGSGTVSVTSITAPLVITFDPSCVGTVADKATETDTLTLSRQ